MKPLDVPWDRIKIEFSHGVSLPTLAKKYNIKLGTLSARSAREGWMETRPETHATRLQDTLIESAKLQGLSLAEAGQAYAARMFRKTSALAEAAEIKQIRSPKDLEIIDKIARRAAGLDTAETQINTVIGLNMLDQNPDFAPVIDGDFVMEKAQSSGATE